MTYDWSQFHLRMYYLAPVTEVYTRFATAQGLASFFIHEAQHTTAQGAPLPIDQPVSAGVRYQWTYVHDYAHDGEFLLAEADRHLAFTFGSMRVDIYFSPHSTRNGGSATEVHLHQTGCATEDPDRAWQHLNCRSCWIYFMTNLRAILAGDPDLRDHDHPQWNDSVSIGFDPAVGAGTPRT
ncbi:MAG: SRPBCC domain-containing protein [Pseudomonadota bacterium]